MSWPPTPNYVEKHETRALHKRGILMEGDSDWASQIRNGCEKVEDVYLFNDRIAITFSYRPDLYDTRLGSFSRLGGAEVYLGAIWNYLVWQRPDVRSFEDELRDEVLTMLVSTTISHEITHEVIDEIEPSHLIEMDFEEKIIHEIDDMYQKDFSERIRKLMRRISPRQNLPN